MSEDKLKEIKKWVNGNNELGVKTAKRLISELEKSRVRLKQLEEPEALINDWRGAASIEAVRATKWKDRAEKAEAEVEKWVAHTLLHNFNEMEKCSIFHDYCRCSTPENTEARLTELEQAKAEVKRLNALLANMGVNSRG